MVIIFCLVRNMFCVELEFSNVIMDYNKRFYYYSTVEAA